MHDTLAPLDSRQLRHGLVNDLLAKGALTSPEWIAAFEEVPRESFVRTFALRDPGSMEQYSPADGQAWIAAVYQNRPLLTTFVDGVRDATSGSSEPTVMAAMLEALWPDEGDTVLEIGTGTGYNAALLCHRFGDSNVTSIDVNAGLVEHARENLESVGYRPTLVAGDGRGEAVSGTKYDRLIATCSVRRVPVAWLSQVRDGGRIVVPIGSALLSLRVQGGEATGRAITQRACFMRARDIAGLPEVPLGDIEAPEDAMTDVYGDMPDMDNRHFVEFARIVAPNVERINVIGGGWILRDVETGDKSWIDRSAVMHISTPSPWDRWMRAYGKWEMLGRPELQDLKLTVEADGTHVFSRFGYASVAI